MIKRIISVCAFIFTAHVNGQVGVGTTTPDASSVLEIYSINKGVLVPRMTSAQRDAITNPANGLLVYNTSESCLQVNLGTTTIPNWGCVGYSSSSLSADCETNSIEGFFVVGETLGASHKYTTTITNSSSNSVNLTFAPTDLTFSGISGVTGSTVTPTSATIAPGASQAVEYTLGGAPASSGVMEVLWSNNGIVCLEKVDVTQGDANFELPQTINVLSVHDGPPLVSIQGIIDNATNQLTIDIPYTSGVGTYSAYSGTYIANNANGAENADANSFRITYPAGTFSTSGVITATIEVDGDGTFNVTKEAFGSEVEVVSLDFQVNGLSKGNVSIKAIGGIPDRNFSDADHKFVYVPVLGFDGNYWLNQNLGANYANFNHSAFSTTAKSTAFSDYNAYGSLYQWGRYSDGHELVNWSSSTSGTRVYNTTTSTFSTTDDPGHNIWIIGIPASNFDWRTPGNDLLWQGEAGTNNPCPEGYRVPTFTEFDNLVTLEEISNATDAASSNLGFPSAGVASRQNGTIGNAGSRSEFWTSTIGGTNARPMRFLESSVSTGSNGRANGRSIRCIKD